MSPLTTPDVTLAAPPRRLLDRALWALALLATWPVVALSFWLRPDARGFGTHQQLGLPPCSFEAVTRVPCPGCGLTTSFTNAAHLHVVDAFRAHLMGPLLFALTVAVAAAAPLGVRRGWSVARVLSEPWLTAWLGVTLAAGMVTFGVRLAHRFL
jgi:hypothetical protein